MRARDETVVDVYLRLEPVAPASHSGHRNRRLTKFGRSPQKPVRFARGVLWRAAAAEVCLRETANERRAPKKSSLDVASAA
jgi:hypothetical protein